MRDLDAPAGGPLQPSDEPGGAQSGSGPRVPEVRAQPGPIPWGRTTAAVGLLSIVSASLALALALWAVPEDIRGEFLGKNQLEAQARDDLLLAVGAAAAFPVLAASVLLALGRGRAAAELTRAADALGPLAVAFAIPSLLDYQRWYTQPTTHLVLLLAVVLVFERLARNAFAVRSVGPGGFVRAPRWAALRARLAGAAPLAVVVLAALGYAAYTSYFTILAHQRLATAAFDLGIFDNLMFNAMHGRPFKSTVAVPHGSYLSNHAEYAMFLFVPLYALRPGPETLLVLQSVMMGLAAVPLYFFARTQVSRGAAAVLACAYLLYAPLHGPNFYDFHFMPLSMFFVFWLLHAVVRRNVWAIALLVPIIYAMREDAALGLIMLGVFLLVTDVWPRLGVVLAAVSAVWFVIVKFVIMPWAGPWWFADIYKELVAPGEHGYGSIVKTILVNPNYFLKTLLTEPKLTYALHLFAPLALVPLRRPAFVLLMLPGFLVTLMTTGYGPTLSIAFQYTTTWIPWLFGSMAVYLRLHREQLGPAALRATLAAVCLGVVCHSYVFGALLQRNTFQGGFQRVVFEMTAEERQRYRDLRAVAALIPQYASVAANEQIVPHVSTRKSVFTLRNHHGDADYLLLYKRHLNGQALKLVRDAVERHPYGLVAQRGEFYLFKRGFQSAETEAAVKALRLRTPAKKKK